MKAVHCTKFAAVDESGQLRDPRLRLRDVLVQVDVPLPECSPNSVLIRPEFVGIQYPDSLQAQGLYQEKPDLPYIPGTDLAGTVVEVGADVTHVQVGDSVIAQTSIGALAELVAIDSSSVWLAPDGLELATCANMGRNYLAAYHALKVVGNVQAGDLVLVDGASGGVGMAAVALAKAMEANVIAGVSSSSKAKLPSTTGADRVLVYGTEKAGYKQFKIEVKQAAKELGHAQGVDVIVDVVHGDLFESALVSCVRPLGRICLVGFAAGQRPIRPGLLLIKQAAVIGSLWSPWARENPEAHQRNVSEVLAFFASGKVTARVDRIFPFENCVEAFELYENNLGQGNTVIAMGSPVLS